MPPSSEFDQGAGRLLGTNDLQQTIDEFNTAVNTLTSTVSNMATNMGNGLTRSPSHSVNAEGAMFSMGSLNAIAEGGNGGFPYPNPLPGGGYGGRYRGAATVGQGGGTSGSPPTMGQTASGGGANGGGATFGGSGSSGSSSTSSGGSSGAGSSSPPTIGSTASGGGANGGGATFGGRRASGGSGGPPVGGGPYGPAPTVPGGGMGATPASFTSAAGTVAGGITNLGMGMLPNQLLYNAYGQQMAATYGQSAQSAQNAAFGYYNTVVNAAAAGNPQSAAAEFGTLNSMTGGGTLSMANPLAATNAFAFANQGLGAAGAASLTNTMYNPVNSLRMMLLTGTSAINPQTGQLNSLSSIIGGLANMGYIGGGGWNAKSGTFDQNALNASFVANRGRSYMSLQALGYNPSQIQDIQSTVSQANQAAIKGHTSMQNVLGLMNQAEYGTEAQTQAANKQLASMGVNLSTIMKQGNQASLNMATSQGMSSTYNDAVSGFTNAMTKATQAVNWFLDKTGLGKAVGAVSGGMTGYQTSGMGNAVSGVTTVAGMGGGASSVSTTQPMTSQGSRPGSSMSAPSPQVATAVRDAEGQVGKPYVYGGDTPQTSFDCSGLVMWSYGQAGIRLPRTSQQQWASLRNKSVPLSQVREGDIVFAAGSDGSAQNPGHEALMISSSQIVEAPYTGANIRIRSFNPGEWQHAARPVGAGGGSTGAGTSVSGTKTGYAGSSLFAGNSGGSGDSSLGLTTDADSLLFSGGGTGTGAMSTATNGGATSSGAGTGNATQTFTGGGSASQNQALAKKMAQQLYGWSGSEWTAGLLPLWTQESGFQTKAKNPQSGAYGIPQSLPASKMASAGSDYLTNSATQIKWGLGYIKGRYGDPLAAEAHEKSYNWYGTGGPIVVGDRGPELFVPKQSGNVMSAKDTSSLLRGTSAQPAQAPYTASPAAQLLLDTLSPANHHAKAQSGSGGGVAVQMTFAPGAINIAGSGGGLGTSNDVQAIQQGFEQAVGRAIQKSNLLEAVRAGDTG